MTWQPDDRLIHRFNADLGPGRVVGVEGRTVVVFFPGADTTLRLAVDSEALARLELAPGMVVHHRPSDSQATIVASLEEGRVRLDDGRIVDEADLWPVQEDGGLVDLLAAGKIDGAGAFGLRLDTIRLRQRREADGLGSFVGGRIRLFPHQLYVAEKATGTDPVRMLLADEVGLGKTVESCLILNHLLVTGRAERAMVVAPETLTVQWLGELWRKYHQVFVLIDDQRLADVAKEHGPGFNPFDVYDRVVVSRERLETDRKLAELAVLSAPDLVIVDEAHHLRRRPDHPGNPAYRAVAPLAALGRHLLLLSAVPLEDDAHGFFRLLQLLRPEEMASFEAFRKHLESGQGLPPCTSATRRTDIGGLPPRIGVPVDLEADDWKSLEELLQALRQMPAENAASRRRLSGWIHRASSSGASLTAALPRQADRSLRDLAQRAEQEDPRVEWLCAHAASWRRREEKTLVFVSDRHTLEMIRTALERRGVAVGVFHEDLSLKQRDIGVAQFRLPDGPAILISTECGGEGRNFEFCHRLVSFDLPWNPVTLEQRIGRLDRIGRDRPVEIVYFRPRAGWLGTVAEIYERLGIFERPLGSLEKELASVENALEELAFAETAGESTDHLRFERILDEVEAADRRVEAAAYRELHREPYRPEMAATILERLPGDLQALTRRTVLGACTELCLQVEESDVQNGFARRCSIELDSRARVESLPGLGSDATFVGTFDRETAVEDETLDFFSTGHPLVESLLAHLEEDPLGRVGLLRLPGNRRERGLGLMAVFTEGTRWEAVALDLEGRERPDWLDRLLEKEIDESWAAPRKWTDDPSWPSLVQRLARPLEGRPRPVALAVFQIG